MESLVSLVRELGVTGVMLLFPCLCGIVAIICQAWVQVRRMQFRHAERLAMIQRGLDPGTIDDGGDDTARTVAKPASPAT
jgi:hypothetical protein